MPNIFKKLQQGASNFFNKLPSQANNIVKKVDGGLNQGLGVVRQIANQAGNALEKAAPVVGAIAGGITGDPAIGMAVSDLASQAGSYSKQAGAAAGNLKNANLSQKSVALSNQFGSSTAGTQFQQKLQNRVAGGLSSAMGGLQNVNNQLAQVHQNIANAQTVQPAVSMPPAPVVIH